MIEVVMVEVIVIVVLAVMTVMDGGGDCGAGDGGGRIDGIDVGHFE